MRVRYPMLDDDVVAVAARIPDGLLIRGLKLRYFYRQVFADFLPRATLAKKKKGFGPPYIKWIRHYRPLRDLANDCINVLKAQPIFDPGGLQRIIDRSPVEPGSYLDEMAWKLMLFAMWLQSKHGLTT